MRLKVMLLHRRAVSFETRLTKSAAAFTRVGPLLANGLTLKSSDSQAEASSKRQDGRILRAVFFA